MTDPAPLQFDRAEQVQPSETACAACGQKVREQYYEVGGRTLCEACRRQLGQRDDPKEAPDRFLRALTLGVLGGAAGALVWYAVRWATGYEVGLIAILVGYLVGRGVHQGSRAHGGWLYQGLAVILTYAAIVSTYVPEILGHVGAGPGPEILRLVFVFAIACAAPFLAGFENIIGLLIIFFGLSQAWRMNRRVELPVSGPFRVAALPASPAADA